MGPMAVVDLSQRSPQAGDSSCINRIHTGDLQCLPVHSRPVTLTCCPLCRAVAGHACQSAGTAPAVVVKSARPIPPAGPAALPRRLGADRCRARPAVALEERELAELNQIAAALARITDGSYGNAPPAGADVGVARLQANPVAERCIAQARPLEQAQGQPHTPSM